jgi:hypothetical protein
MSSLVLNEPKVVLDVVETGQVRAAYPQIIMEKKSA